MKVSPRIQMAKLARCDERMAELNAELAEVMAARAKILRELADGETVDPRTLRRLPKRHETEIPEPSDAARALAKTSLRQAGRRRRFGA